MNIVEALELSNTLAHPDVNGYIVVEEDYTIRIYINELTHEYHSYNMDLGPRLLRSKRWTPVELGLTVKIVKE